MPYFAGVNDDFKKLGHKAIEVSGKEAADFLHRLSAQDIKNLKPGDLAPAAFLDSKSHVIGLPIVFCFETKFWLAVFNNFYDSLLSYLEKMHFAEDLTISPVVGYSSYFVRSSRIPEVSTGKFEIRDIFGAPALLRTPRILKGAVLSYEKPIELGLNEVSDQEWNALLMESGQIILGRDFDEKTLALELPLKEFVSRVKGCYPGQEVVERIFTYGNVNKKLMALSGPLLKAGDPLTLQNQNVGRVTAFSHIPWRQENLGLGYINKPHFEVGQTFDSSLGPVKTVPLHGSF